MRVADQMTAFYTQQIMDKNKYFYNYEADLVVREDENGERYFKTLEDHLTERHSKNKESKAIWGIPSYGIFNKLFPISKKRYDEFGITWKEISPGNLNNIV